MKQLQLEGRASSGINTLKMAVMALFLVLSSPADGNAQSPYGNPLYTTKNDKLVTNTSLKTELDKSYTVAHTGLMKQRTAATLAENTEGWNDFGASSEGGDGSPEFEQQLEAQIIQFFTVILPSISDAEREGMGQEYKNAGGSESERNLFMAFIDYVESLSEIEIKDLLEQGGFATDINTPKIPLSGDLLAFLQGVNATGVQSDLTATTYATSRDTVPPKSPFGRAGRKKIDPSTDDLITENAKMLQEEFLRMYGAEVEDKLGRLQDAAIVIKRFGFEIAKLEERIEMKQDLDGKGVVGRFIKDKSGDSKLEDFDLKDAKRHIKRLEEKIRGRRTNRDLWVSDLNLVLEYYADKDLGLEVPHRGEEETVAIHKLLEENEKFLQEVENLMAELNIGK